MASFIFDHALYAGLSGGLNFETDAFRVLLLDAAGVALANKGTQTHRGPFTGNEIAGTGYTSGGVAADLSVSKDTTNHRIEIALPGNVWASAGFTAYGALYVRWRGGASTSDEVVALNDFGGPVVATAGNWTLAATTARIVNG